MFVKGMNSNILYMRQLVINTFFLKEEEENKYQPKISHLQVSIAAAAAAAAAAADVEVPMSPFDCTRVSFLHCVFSNKSSKVVNQSCTGEY